MEIADMSKADAGKASAAETRRKVATCKNQLDKEIVVSGLHNFLPAATVNEGVIAKLKKSYIV